MRDLAAEAIDDIAKALGVPERVLHGAYRTTYAEHYKYLERRDERRREQLRAAISETMVRPLLEKNLPELFWEMAYILSPRGRAMRRRKNPVTIKFD